MAHTPDSDSRDMRPYQAYLVRCWREGSDWRFSLEGIGRDRQRLGFSRLEELMAHIQASLSEEGDDQSSEFPDGS